MSNAILRKLSLAVEHHRAGRLKDAADGYGQVLRKVPRHGDALHLLGLVRYQQGDAAEAERLITEAIRVQPTQGAYYENLSAVQRSRGDLAAIVETARRGLQKVKSPVLEDALLGGLIGASRFAESLEVLDALDARSAPTDARLADRALCLFRLGKLDRAAAVASDVLTHSPANLNALSVAADIATAQGRHAAAVELWSKALSFNPTWTAARINRALSQLNSGRAIEALDGLLDLDLPGEPELALTKLNVQSAAARAQKDGSLAARFLRQAVALAPGDDRSWMNLSEVVRPFSAPDSADFSRRALALNPGHVGAHINHAIALVELDRLEAALGAFRRALAISPADAALMNNMTGPHRWNGDFARAIALYRRALAVDPAFAPARHGLGTAHLIAGTFEEGWRAYEGRISGDPEFHIRPFTTPRWGREALDGSLLVWGEQGLGDEVFFAALLPDVMRVVKSVVVECDPRLVGIFARSFPPATVVGRTDPPAPVLTEKRIVAQIPAGSLAGYFRSRTEDFGDARAFLIPRPDLVQRWRERVADLGSGHKVGFAWRTSRGGTEARRYHPALREWMPVLTRSDAVFISLQYGAVDDDIRIAAGEYGVALHRFTDFDLRDDLENLLALSSVLDLSICTLTTPFNFPAAAGTPTWVLAPKNDMFLLGGGREHLWYRSVRLYLRAAGEPWCRPIGEIADDLAVRLGAASVNS